MWSKLLAWRSRIAPPPATAAAPAPEMAVTAAMEARVARWFAAEAPETVALAVESLRALARASPRFVDRAIPNPTPLAWLASALDRLERFPEPLPIPRDAPRLSWRYLLWTRMVCDRLEAAYDELRRRGIAARCPLTDLPDPFPPPREMRLPRERSPAPPAGLGALVAGTRLPDAGQRWLLEAHAEGLPWADSAAFWRRLGLGITAAPEPAPAQTAPAPKPPPPPQRPPQPAPAAPAAMPDRGRAAESRTAPADVATPSAPVDAPLDALAHAALAALVAHPGFNRHSGDAWLHEGVLYVAAKAFARALHAHPWVRAHPEFQNRKALYRWLADRRLIVPDGGQKVWHLWICEDGQADPRYVSALKMSATRTMGLTARPAFRGWLRPATAREIRAFRSR